MLVLIVAARVIATLVVYDETTERGCLFLSHVGPRPPPLLPRVIARPFWPRLLLPHHFFLHFDTIFDYVYFPSYSELVKAFKLILVGIINLAAVL